MSNKTVVRLGKKMQYPILFLEKVGHKANFIAGIHFGKRLSQKELRQWKSAMQKAIDSMQSPTKEE